MKDRGVSIAGDGVEIGRLQIHMDSKRTSDIKNHILESRFDDNYENGGKLSIFCAVKIFKLSFQ